MSPNIFLKYDQFRQVGFKYLVNKQKQGSKTHESMLSLTKTYSLLLLVSIISIYSFS